MATILIVDDSEIIRFELQQVLEAEGHKVIVGVDGKDGISKAKQHQGKIDLLIADYNMPNMDGLSMLAEINKLPDAKDAVKFMLTSEASSELKKQGKDLGVKVWINKPFKQQSLVAVVKKVLT